MSLFQAEAFGVGLKEGAKILLALLVVRTYLLNQNRKGLYRVVLFFLLLCLFISGASLFFPSTTETSAIVVKAVGYSFGLYYLLALALLYSASKGDIWGGLGPVMKGRVFQWFSAFLLSALFVIPDLSGSLLFIKGQALLKESSMPFVSMGAGFVLVVFAGYALLKERVRGLTALFELPQVVLFLALLKLLGGGTGGFAELTLIPAVQKGLMKLIHDIVHQTFVTIMVPDHPILKTTTWNFIGILFGERIALWLSLVVLFVPLLAFVLSYLNAPVEVPSTIEPASRRRKYKKEVKTRRLMRAVPVFVFMLFLLINWFSQRGEAISRLYNPEPRPVVAEKGRVVIPISAPDEDLRDGALHKYTVEIEGQSIRFLIVKREDGSLSVCLDACEICPPEGYAQGEGHLVCLYCRTPINIQSLGKAGGCNPIPLKALVTDRDIQIETSELLKKWQQVKTRQSRNILER